MKVAQRFNIAHVPSPPPPRRPMQRKRSPGRQPQSDSDQPLTQSRSVTLTLFVDSESTLCDFRGLVTIAGRDRRQKKSPDVLPATANLFLSSRPPPRNLSVPSRQRPQSSSQVGLWSVHPSPAALPPRPPRTATLPQPIVSSHVFSPGPPFSII